ncbi:MAG: hypothetical protein JW908_04340 [Anaerolineales bacterium]|nr:hypothetical protein [Anaerolineales bacterium]
MIITDSIILLTLSESVELKFTKEQLISAVVVEEFNPITAELPISTLEFSIINNDDRLSMFSGEYYALLSERLPILVYERITEGDDPVERLIGKFYLDSWENVSESEFKFRAVDLIGVLETTAYDGNFWSEPTSTKEILEALLTSINAPYSIASEVDELLISGWNPPGTYRTAIQQICFAAGICVSTSRSQKLNINLISLPSLFYDKRIYDSQKLLKQPIELQPLVTSIELIAHNYSQDDNIETIFEAELEAGLHKIVFDKPYYDITVEGGGYIPVLLASEDGTEIVTENEENIEAGGEFVFGANSLFLDLTEGGEVTVKGYPWKDNKKSFTFNETGVTEFTKRLDLKIENATLINSTGAPTILSLLRDFYRIRYNYSFTGIPNDLELKTLIRTNINSTVTLVGIIHKINRNLSVGNMLQVDTLSVVPVYVPPEENPFRKPRTGIALSGDDLIRQNMFRRYA